jgi:hypothetical protein
MKKPVWTFIVGLLMLVVGLFWLTSVVQVSSIWGSGLQIGGVSVSGGFTLVPLIFGIIWLFYNPKSTGAKILSVVGVVVIIAGIIMSIRFYVRGTSLYVFIIIFVCIAGGAGLLARFLLTGNSSSSKPDK